MQLNQTCLNLSADKSAEIKKRVIIKKKITRQNKIRRKKVKIKNPKIERKIRKINKIIG